MSEKYSYFSAGKLNVVKQKNNRPGAVIDTLINQILVHMTL
jgi:hypothetical protein